MVDIAEIVDEQEQQVPASQERLLDAEEIDAAAKGAKRMSVRMQLEALAKKLRKESDALRRMENSSASLEKKAESKEEPAAAAAAPVAAPPAPTPVTTPAPAVAPTTGKFTPIDRFSFDFGEYNSAFVTLYIPLPGVGSIPKSSVTCNFTSNTFDLIVQDLDNKSYRLFKDNLEKDIDPSKSKFIVKADKVVVKLAKKKGEYGSYDFWSKLTDKGNKKKASEKENPQASIMELMKNMYEEGDDNMKKVIGETMMKQQRGELGKDGLAGAGGMGGMNLDDDF